MTKSASLLFSCLFIVSICIASPVITAVNNGNWASASTWNLNRIPTSGDTVIIPAGRTVTISSSLNYAFNLFVKVRGTLAINDGKLKIEPASVIEIASGAGITGTGLSSEQIQIGTVIKFRGTEYYKGGPAVADNSTAATPNGFRSSASGALPVRFASFQVACLNNSLILDWSTAQESNSSHFEVMRSENGIDWRVVATVQAAGNSTELKKYFYTDRNVSAAKIFYRIRIVDLDGKAEFSVVRSVSSQESDVVVKVNSTLNGNLLVHYSTQVKGASMVKVLTTQGQLVSQTALSNPVGQQLVQVPQNLKGIYIVVVSQAGGKTTSAQVLL